MKENAKCFIFGSNGYVEITYGELKANRKNDPQYKKNHFFIFSDGILMEVSKADYDYFCKNEGHEKYLAREAKRVDKVSLDSLDTDEFSGVDIVVDPSSKTEEIVMKKLMLEMMHQCLDKLPESDRSLIRAVYFDGVSQTEYAEKHGITPQAVSKKCKKKLNNSGK